MVLEDVWHLYIVTIHNIIDSAEREISEKLNIYLVIHMDPMCIHCEIINGEKEKVEKIIKKYDCVKSMHDFRLTEGNSKKNLIFDVVVDAGMINSKEAEEEWKNSIIEDIKKLNPEYNCIITIDKEV